MSASQDVVPEQQPKRAKNAFLLFADSLRGTQRLSHGEGLIGKAKLVVENQALGAMWRSLSASEKVPFEERAAKLTMDYRRDAKTFRASGVAKQKRGETNRRKRRKDKDRPKMPPCGGYGVFIRENLPDIRKSLPAGMTQSCFIKVAAAQWRGLPDAAKLEYQEKHSKLNAEYKEKLDLYNKQRRKLGAKEASVRILVQLAHGTSATLVLVRVTCGTESSCYWRLTSKPPQAGAKAATPLLALRAWLSKHACKLSTASKQELETWCPPDMEVVLTDPTTYVEADYASGLIKHKAMAESMVKGRDFAEFGRKVLLLAAQEMPELVAARTEMSNESASSQTVLSASEGHRGLVMCNLILCAADALSSSSHG
mmetsp:Transcript_104074/g.206781  ORF Transcript_104074/g.206781 Transcript_104074/m.206781 type:complete len:369 (-) Transcript_104074:9-1115(-)